MKKTLKRKQTGRGSSAKKTSQFRNSAKPPAQKTKEKAADGATPLIRRSNLDEGARNRALNALALMRREKLSLSEACRQEHIKPTTFRRYVGSAVRQDRPGGRFHATKGDSFRRDLQIPTAQGPAVISVYGSKNARLFADYLNAINEWRRTGKQEKLARFIGKKVTVEGKVIELITDPDMLLPLAEADVLHIDQLYASATGRA